MHAMYIQVYAFRVNKIVVRHLPVYAFPGVYQRFYHTSRTRASSQGSTVRLLLSPVTASACRQLGYAEEQRCLQCIAAEAVSIPPSRQSTRSFSAAAATPHHILNKHKAR